MNELRKESISLNDGSIVWINGGEDIFFESILFAFTFWVRDRDILYVCMYVYEMMMQEEGF